MKKLMTATVLLCLLLALAACGEAEPQNANAVNPWIDCATLAEAEDLAQFDIAVPDRIEGYPNTMIQAVKDEVIQVFYYDQEPGEGDRDVVLIRKGVGTEDLSGDYTEYPENETVAMHGVEVSLRGEDGLVYTAAWSQDGYTYSIHADSGMEKAQVEDLVELVK